MNKNKSEAKRKKIENAAPFSVPAEEQIMEAFSYDNGTVVSATEMTGLTALMPTNDPEAAAYGELLGTVVKPSGSNCKNSRGKKDKK